MKPVDFLLLIHPALAVILVFPLVGIVLYFALSTRQRRLQTTQGEKSKIPPMVGISHVQLGKWLAATVVGITLIGLAYPITEHLIKEAIWQKNPFQVIFVVLIFLFTIASLVMLYRGRQKPWRATFATLAGMGIVILGCQDGVFRRTNEWYWSHYYFGVIVALLMIFSLAIIEDIYQDRSLKWRKIHAVLNTIAILLFIGQGMTGVRDILEIGIYKLGGGPK